MSAYLSKKPRLALLCAILAACFLLVSCGKKEWPEPFAPEDQFEWKDVTATRQGQCVALSSVLSGAYYNLRGVTVEWTELGPDGDCPACPFTPRYRVELPANSGLITRDGPKISVRVCQIPPGKEYRFRLTGANVYDQLSDAVSSVVDLR